MTDNKSLPSKRVKIEERRIIRYILINIIVVQWWSCNELSNQITKTDSMHYKKYEIYLTDEADLFLPPSVLKRFFGNGICEWLLDLLSMVKWLQTLKIYDLLRNYNIWAAYILNAEKLFALKINKWIFYKIL